MCKRIKQIQDNDSIALRYLSNPNGSTYGIAGITNKKGNVLGMMPHPERACDIIRQTRWEKNIRVPFKLIIKKVGNFPPLNLSLYSCFWV